MTRVRNAVAGAVLFVGAGIVWRFGRVVTRGGNCLVRLAAWIEVEAE